MWAWRTPWRRWRRRGSPRRAPAWTSTRPRARRSGSFFGDTVSGFQDGSDLIDLRGSGLQFADLAIVNEDFQTTITSDRGQITIFESFGQEVFIDVNDFIFTPAPAAFL